MKIKKNNKKVIIEADGDGVTFWRQGKWILDASMFLSNNTILIYTKAFKVAINDDRNRMTLILKK